MMVKRGQIAGKGMDRRGANLLMNHIVFIIIIAAFAAIMIMFIIRFGTQASIKEQIYAKQIALAIDKARAGTSITLDISELYDSTRESRFGGRIINIDNENKKVIIHLAAGNGYSYMFFNDNPVVWNIDEKKGEEKLTLHVG